jgi:hypothetical protein
VTSPIISPMSLDALTYDYWGFYDAAVIAQLAPLSRETCYQPKFYKAPATAQEVVPANGYVTYGLKITPGSLIVGVYLPALVSTAQAPQYNLQITDENIHRSDGRPRKFWDSPIPSFFLANYKPTFLSSLAYPAAGAIGSFPNLFNAPYPVVGDGLFLVEIWETSGAQQRIELVIGCLEVVEPL